MKLFSEACFNTNKTIFTAINIVGKDSQAYRHRQKLS